MTTRKRYHLLEIEFTLHRGLDIKADPVVLMSINEWFQKLYPDSKIQVVQIDPEDPAAPMGISITGLNATNCPQSCWWLIKHFSAEGWEMLDVEYITPSNIFYSFQYTY